MLASTPKSIVSLNPRSTLSLKATTLHPLSSDWSSERHTTTIRNDEPPLSSSLSCRPLSPSLYLRRLLRFFLHTESWYSTMVTDIAYGLDIVRTTIAASDFWQNSPLSTLSQYTSVYSVYHCRTTGKGEDDSIAINTSKDYLRFRIDYLPRFWSVYC